MNENESLAGKLADRLDGKMAGTVPIWYTGWLAGG